VTTQKPGPLGSGCYYLSQALLQQRKEDAASLPRVPADDFEQLVSGRIVEVLGADARMKAALSKLGWNNEEDRRQLLRIIIQRIEVANGMIHVRLDPAAALAGQAERLRPGPRIIEIAYDLVKAPAAFRSMYEPYADFRGSAGITRAEVERHHVRFGTGLQPARYRSPGDTFPLFAGSSACSSETGDLVILSCFLTFSRTILCVQSPLGGLSA
jgi:hypothetical protein